ncbi:probable maltase-glucoamylase 2 isoform X23 [Xyrauchen texanus]|uniref:probable maltase-glucoamylase 2 isoform X23 n=1 Tax=Xyrauchen texanus TaxID=154827 RepID=UPI0022427FF8|nr:probable maltase-glucoamylase 2 isoform X23 [Xyrauchen texanus]
MFPVTQHLLVFTIISVLSLTRAQTTTLGTTTVASSITSDGSFTTTTTATPQTSTNSATPQTSANPGTTSGASSIMSDGSFITTTTATPKTSANPGTTTVASSITSDGSFTTTTTATPQTSTNSATPQTSANPGTTSGASSITSDGSFITTTTATPKTSANPGTTTVASNITSDGNLTTTTTANPQTSANPAPITQTSAHLGTTSAANSITSDGNFTTTTTIPQTSANPAATPQTSTNPGTTSAASSITSDGSLTTTTTTPQTSTNPATTPQTSANPANPQTSANPAAIPQTSANPGTTTVARNITSDGSFTTSTTTPQTSAHPELNTTTNIGSSNFSGIFYPFGSAAGDTSNIAQDDGSSTLIGLLSPFNFFERTYRQIYVNNNGHLTFNQSSWQYVPYYFPAKGNQDIIAGFWTDLDNRRGVVSYQQYTNGSVLTHATQDIKQYFPDLSFNATWVFVATWDKVAYCCTTNTETSFQVVLISAGNSSFILINYGDIAAREQTIAGYDTEKSSHYFVIPGSNNGNGNVNLKFSSNVNVTGRWAFRVDIDPNIISKEFNTTTNIGSSNFSGIFYPFGSAAGDTRNSAEDDGSSTLIGLLSPYKFFERTYRQIYVNNNGHLTFNQPSGQYFPYYFPAYGGQDIIAGFWTDLDNRRGVVSYQQYTNGSVLTHATQDIKKYFPDLSFSATWVFVATWDKVAYCCTTNTETSFQVVLISAGDSSFILMNYGDIAGKEQTIAGYDTVYSSHYFVIPGSNNGNGNLTFSSNVNVTGRWAFRVDIDPNNISKENVIGLQVKLTSFLNLSQNENINLVLDQLKQELIKNGLPNSTELTLRKIQKTNP